MKVYVSADIEGVAGISHWHETDSGKSDYAEFRDHMTAEVAAACEGALTAGCTELWVKDAHDSGRNLLAAQLPQAVQIVRNWSGHPFCMVQGLDESFAAVAMVGYHSPAGMGTNPLSHTMSGALAYIKINGELASEFLIHAYAAALVNVPVIFVAGDAGLCEHVKAHNPNITTQAVSVGEGASSRGLHPLVAAQRIREGMRVALSGDLAACRIALPPHFSVEIAYKEHTAAYRASFYPGMRQLTPYTVLFETEQYFEVLRMMMFAL